MDLFREPAVRQIARYITGNKVFLYPEERDEFHWVPLEALLSEADKPVDAKEKVREALEQNNAEATEKSESEDLNEDEADEAEDPAPFHLAPVATALDNEMAIMRTNRSEIRSILTRTSTAAYTLERFKVEQAISAEKTKSIAIAPTKTRDGVILVDWYTTDDPSNPQNWPASKKGWVLTQLCFYSMAVYGASSMYVPGEEGVMQKFKVGATLAALGLAIEIASIGRNWVYVPTFFLFVVLSIPTAVVDNFAGLLVLRFLTGFFGSPCLANGGASVGDLYSLLELPVYLSAWTAACFWGPAIGPLVAGFAVQARDWCWGLWEVV